jgi:integrase/recombinase XerC
MVMSELPPQAQAFLTQLLTQRQLSPLTQKRYAHCLGVLHGIDANLSLITGPQMQRAISQHHAAGLSPRSLAVMASSWRSYCQWAHKQGLLAIDSSRDLLLPKIGSPLPKALAIDQTENFLKQQATATKDLPLADLNLRDQAVLEVLYGCGLRASELLGLDCAKSAGSLGWLDAAAPALRVLGKGNKPRVVPLPNMALAAIQAWLAVSTNKHLHENALFLGIRGGRLSGTELRRITQRRAVRAQSGQGVHPHMLRHSYASHLLQNSQDLRGVQELLGHASIRATQVYTRLDFQHLAKVYDLTHPRALTASKASKIKKPATVTK